MKQSIHELLPEMAWQAEVLYKLGRIVELLQNIEAGLSIRPGAPTDVEMNVVVPDDIDWESTDVTDCISAKQED